MPILSLGIGMVLTLETGVVSDHFFVIFHPWVSLSLGQALASLRRLQQSHPSLGRRQIRWQCLGLLRFIGFDSLQDVASFIGRAFPVFFHCFPIREISVLTWSHGSHPRCCHQSQSLSRAFWAPMWLRSCFACVRQLRHQCMIEINWTCWTRQGACKLYWCCNGTDIRIIWLRVSLRGSNRKTCGT